MNTKNKTQTAKDLIADLCNKYGDNNRNFIFRGTREIFSGEPTGVNSSLYRWAKDAINEYHKPPKIEEEIVEKARRLFLDKTSNIEILTDLRHYGGKVNLIDFTHSIYAALFFACNGDFDKDGEIIVLDVNKLPSMRDVEYDKLKDGDVGVIEPAKTQASQLRVAAQDSIFVYFVDGYIEESYFKNEIIRKELKNNILDFIRKFSNIDQDTIYNDLIGFIENEKNYETAGIHLYQGNAKYESRKYKEAIECYSEAIELNPQYVVAYNNRGVVKSSLGEIEEAIKNFNKAIELNPQYAEAYYSRGNAKSYSGEHEEAIKDYNKAIEFNPQFSEAYNNRGNAKSFLGKDGEAIKDYNQAIELNSQDADAYNNRGFSKSRLDEYEEAIKDYNKAIELNPQFASAYYNRGFAKEGLGDTTGVEADFAKARELKKQQKKK